MHIQRVNITESKLTSLRNITTVEKITIKSSRTSLNRTTGTDDCLSV